MSLRICDLKFGYKTAPILHGITIPQADPGTLTAVVGPNAAGNSTLFKCIAGLLRASGAVFIDETISTLFSSADLAGKVCYLPQDFGATAMLTAFEAILLARKRGADWRVSDPDKHAVAAIMAQLNVGHLSGRYLDELSGGQRQLIAVCQALARDPSVLLMDEPTSALDLRHQLEVLSLMRAVTQARRLTTLVAIHDLNLAARFADRIVVLADGRVAADGTPPATLTPQMLADVYGIDARVVIDDGAAFVIPLGSRRATVPDRSGQLLRKELQRPRPG